MNWITGLKRLSAVTIGGFACFLLFIGVAEMHSQATLWTLAGFVAMCIVGALVVHKLICWLIDGFVKA